MLKITVPGIELFNDDTQMFITTKDTELQLEHSLISVAKWEAKWHKAFLSKKDKTDEETLDYIRAMTISQNVDENVYRSMTPDIKQKIFSYIEDPMTATYFAKDPNASARSRETVTSELIYYWMVAFNIPFECQKWHLNRLLVLIDVCNRKNQPAKKTSAKDLRSRNRSLNEARRAALGTKG